MSLQEVSAQVRTGDRANQVFTVKMDIPDTIQEAISKYGEEIVFSQFMASLIIDAQARMRGEIKKDDCTPEKVQAVMSEWTPKTRAPARPLSERIAELLRNMSEEERKEFLAEYI